MGQNRSSLRRQSESKGHMQKQEQTEVSSTFHQQVMSHHSPVSRALICDSGLSWKEMPSTDVPHTSSFPIAFMSEVASYGLEYPFGLFGSSGLSVHPPKVLPTSQPAVGGGNVGKVQLWCCASC